MGLKLKGLETTLTTFREVDRRFKKAAAEELERGAKAIADLARRYAPVDKGDLVKSIRAQRVTSDATSTKWRVKVGGTIGGRDVSEYADGAHAGYSTNRTLKGGYGSSARTLAKNRARALSMGLAAGEVGIFFMARAFKKLAPLIKTRVALALQDQLQAIALTHSRKR